MRLFFALTGLCLVPIASFAVNCPSPHADGVPTCPEIGLLSEQYPIGAVTVSDAGVTANGDGGQEWAKAYVTNVFKSQPKDPPLAYLSVTDDTYNKLVAEIRAIAPPGDADKWVGQLRRTDMQRYNWQQDFFDGFHDPKTGKPQLRYVKGYYPQPEAEFKKMTDLMSTDCGFTVGNALENGEPYRDGMAGGNLEAVGDFCIIGKDNLQGGYDGYAKSVCDGKNVIKAPTDFMKVGHTDEIYKTIPIPGKEPPCNFAIALASPRKGMELLRSKGSDKAFNRGDANKNNPSFDSLCKKFQRLQDERRNTPQRSEKPRKGQSRLWHPLLRPLWIVARVQDSVAGIGVVPANSPNAAVPASPAPATNKSCDEMTNGDMADLFKANSELSELNDEVQKKIDAFRDELKSKIASKYPGCNPPVIEVPQIFNGAAGKFEDAKALSVFPNPTNGEIVNGKYLMPDTNNTLFKKEMMDQMKKLGIETTPIKTDFAHKAEGNLHCSSHAIRYCKPKGQ